MLPPSVEGENRLHIERNSKVRRIMSNFGLTFRNSKWADYYRSNVVVRSLISLLRMLLKLVQLTVLVTFVITFNNFLVVNAIISPVFSSCFYLIWSLLEATWNGVFFVTWLFASILLITTRWVYSLVFYDVMGNLVKSEPKGLDYNKGGEVSRLLKQDTLESLYHSLNHSIKKELGSKVNLLKSLYETSGLVSDMYGMLCKVFITLYKVLFTFQFDTTVWDFFKLSWKDLYNRTYSYLFPSTINRDLYKNGYVNEFWESEVINSQSLHLLNSRYDYNISTITRELNSYGVEMVQNKVGVFYLGDLTHGYMTVRELRFIPNELLKKDLITNWYKWTYKHNLLHSHLVKNTHKITLAKKLLTTGYYDSTIISNNIWAANEFTKLTNHSFLYSTYGNLYKSLTNTKGLSKVNFIDSSFTKLNNDSYMQLKHFEQSFFWFIKRSYLNNSMYLNKISSLPQPKLLINSEYNTNVQTSFNLNLLTFLRSCDNSGISSIFLKNEVTSNKSTLDFNLTNYVNAKDVTLLYRDTDFLTHESVRMLLNVNGICGSKSINLLTFSSKVNK